jgi:hypothetical protein
MKLDCLEKRNDYAFSCTLKNVMEWKEYIVHSLHTRVHAGTQINTYSMFISIIYIYIYINES